MWVTPAGSKLWRLAYRADGRQKVMALGSYPQVRLIEARERGEDLRRSIRAGADPLAARQRAVAARLTPSGTFEAIAREWYDKERASWVPAHAARILGAF